jgi:O-antigen ligase
MLPVMSARTRVFTGIATVGGLCATFVLVPGMLGTLLGLFTGIGADDSAASRTSSYTLAGEFIGRAPLFGRGFATFLPAYRILDNQFLGTTIELGLVGVTALIVLFLTGILTAAAVRRRSEDPTTKLLAQALMACLAAGASSYAFFDAFSFPMVACLTFLTLGMIGGLRRLSMMSQPVVRAPE